MINFVLIDRPVPPSPPDENSRENLQDTYPSRRNKDLLLLHSFDSLAEARQTCTYIIVANDHSEVAQLHSNHHRMKYFKG